MKIKTLSIKNYKSIEEMELQSPNPFSVFVGPNGAGKSNIFEAVEFAYNVYITYSTLDVYSLYGGKSSIANFNYPDRKISVSIEDHDQYLLNFSSVYYQDTPVTDIIDYNHPSENKIKAENQKKFSKSFSRFFLNHAELKKVNITDESRLSLDASNLEKVLSRVLQNENTREEIVEWLQILIPEFKDIQIETSSLSGDVNYVIFEKHTNKPFPKHLISDGTTNILALLTAVYQSEEPQFLCIEEPENGLHPHVIEHLVSLFRTACKEKGHYIWLNSHSQTLVRQLTADEIIVVEKKNGATTAKQFQGENFFGMKMDDAWLTNALGGGLP